MAVRDLAVLLRGLLAELNDAEKFRTDIVDRQNTRYILDTSNVLRQLLSQIQQSTAADNTSRKLSEEQVAKVQKAAENYVKNVGIELNKEVAKRSSAKAKDNFSISLKEVPGGFIVDLSSSDGSKNLYRVLQDLHKNPRSILIEEINSSLGFEVVNKGNLLDLGHSGKAVVKIQEEVQIGKFAASIQAKQDALKEYIIESEAEIISKFINDDKFFKIGVDVVVLEPEASAENRRKGTLEKAELKSVKEVFTKWLQRGGENGSRWYNQGGSDSAVEYARKKILKASKNAGFKVSENTKTETRTARVKSKSRTRVKVPTKTVNVALDPGRIDYTPEQGIPLITIKDLLNAQLRSEIVPLMTSPRLQYRTGRLANSFRITEITRTPREFPSIGFTYMRSPYDIFDPLIGKAPWNSVGNRSPRDLGEAAIRNAARKLAIGKFYVRRD